MSALLCRIAPLALLLVLTGCATPAAPGKGAGPAPLGAPAAPAAPAGTPGTQAVPAPPAGDQPPPGEEVLAVQPALQPLGDFAAPVPRLVQLQSGLRIYLIERSGAPLQTALFVSRQGSIADPPALPGLASLAAAMLEAGSSGHTQAEVAAAADALGATLRAGVHTDALFVSLSGLPSQLGGLLQLLAGVVLHPNLEEAEWKHLKEQRVAELQAQLAEPREAAGLAFASALYGAHPLGHPALGTVTSVEAARLGDVRSFLAGVVPTESALVIVGAAPADAALAAASTAFASFGAPRPQPTPPGAAAGKKPRRERPQSPPPPAAAPAATPVLSAVPPLPVAPLLVGVDFPGRPQTVLRVGQPAVPRRSPDELALRLLNSVLGGSFSSRLNQNLREQHGFTYGVGSNFAFGRLGGPFGVATSVKTENTGAAVAEIFRELRRVLDEPLSAEELEKGKSLLAYQLVEALQEAESTAQVVAELFVDDLPLDELATFVPRLRALTVSEVQAAARRALQPERMTCVMAGDLARVVPQLEAAGLHLPPPQLRTASGDLRSERP